jgi:hypothetical protein
MKKYAPKSDAQILVTQNKYCNLITSKMGKTWHFIFATVDTLKQTYCYRKDTKIRQKEKYSLTRATKIKLGKVNTTELPPVKRFLYSHIARLRTLFFQDGKVS